MKRKIKISMKSPGQIVVAVILGICLCAIAGCGKSTKEKLMGTWHSPISEGTFTLKADGGCSINHTTSHVGQKPGEPLISMRTSGGDGTWIVDGSIVTLTPERRGDGKDWRERFEIVSVDKTSLTLKWILEDENNKRTEAQTWRKTE
jgi:hypothetical protein